MSTMSFSVRYRGDNPLPATATPGQFVVGADGQLHLGMSDGSHLRLCGCDCKEQLPPLDEEFKLTIDTRQTATGLDGTTTDFYVPAISHMLLSQYDWWIDWSDSSPLERATGIPDEPTVATPFGIYHNYEVAGEYQITIKPASRYDAWLSPLVFLHEQRYMQQNWVWDDELQQSVMVEEEVLQQEHPHPAHRAANKRKVVSLDSPLTVAMVTATHPVHGDISLTPQFMQCDGYGFSIGENFGFTAEWDSITHVGGGFCASMFSYCRTLKSVPAEFNIPQNITEVGYYTANAQVRPGEFEVRNCTSFASGMFNSCNALTSLPDDFTIPPGITAINYDSVIQQGWVNGGFCSTMFYECPVVVNAAFKFPLLAPGEINKGVFDMLDNSSWSGNFALVFTDWSGTAIQTRTIASIINGNETPDTTRTTFGNG